MNDAATAGTPAPSGLSAMVKHRRVLVASLAGTTVEFYDFYIYATAASLVFGPLFFPATSPTAQLMAAYASFALAFLARPLGAAVFGHYGDRIGRKSTLVASLMLMGGSTFLIAFLPTYAMIGWVAPLLLCILRFGQGFGLGGEWGGAALLAVENAPPGWRARFGMMPQLGAPLGFVAANGLFLLLGLWLSDAQFMAWGWRLPFLASALLVIIGLWVRLKMGETPEFKAALEAEPPAAIPLAELLTRHVRATMAGTLAVVCCFALFYISTAFALGYATVNIGMARSEVLTIQLAAILMLALGIIVAGWWSDMRSASRVLIAGCAATVPLGIVFGAGFDAANPLALFLILAMSLLLMGFTYGPLGEWLTALFPPRVRYSGSSFAFNVGGIIGGAMAPIAAQYLVSTHGVGAVGLYLSGAAVISLIGLVWLAPRDSQAD
ncbi:MFS family permease [Sphingobium sp. B8D3C]|nr:MFS family permease [Sphingobium sp. B8D3B]MCW2411961.1 MFS family permease [Sphingobium sp. B8D3D]MCW2415741.1 MFS family permease [Sphingobium sp. B8D3A]MCW2417867.1 MFS family permease [Sphingobium sp. B8D3C]